MRRKGDLDLLSARKRWRMLRDADDDDHHTTDDEHDMHAYQQFTLHSMRKYELG